MYDSQAMRIAEQIDKLHWRARKLIDRLAEEHPNGKAMYETLTNNEMPVIASAEDCIHGHLSKVERWKKKNYKWIYNPDGTF